MLVYINKTLSGRRLREFKNKRKVQLGNPKSGRGRLQELFITKFKSQFKRGSTNLGDRNWSWSLTRLVARRALTVERGKALRTKLQSGSVFPRFL